MKPAVIAAAIAAVFLAGSSVVQAAPIPITRSKGMVEGRSVDVRQLETGPRSTDQASEAILSTRTSTVGLLRDLFSTPVSAESASDASTLSHSQIGRLQESHSATSTSSIANADSASFRPYALINQLQQWTQRQPRSRVPRARRSWQPSIASSDDQSTSRVPADPSISNLDSHTYSGYKYSSKRSALLANKKAQREKYYANQERSAPAKRAYIRRLRVPEGATAEQIALAKEIATRTSDKLSKRRFRANLTPEQKARKSQENRIQYEKRKAKVSAAKATGSINESNVLPQAIADVGVPAHTSALRSSALRLESTGWADQHEPHTATTSSASGPQEAESDPDEDWRSVLALDLFQ